MPKLFWTTQGLNSCFSSSSSSPTEEFLSTLYNDFFSFAYQPHQVASTSCAIIGGLLSSLIPLLLYEASLLPQEVTLTFHRFYSGRGLGLPNFRISKIQSKTMAYQYHMEETSIHPLMLSKSSPKRFSKLVSYS